MAYSRERFNQNTVQLKVLNQELDTLKTDPIIRKQNPSKIANLTYEITELTKENEIIENLISTQLSKDKQQDENKLQFNIPDITFTFSQEFTKSLIKLFTILNKFYSLNRLYFSKDELTIINNEDNENTDMAFKITFPSDLFSQYHVKDPLGIIVNTTALVKAFKSFTKNTKEITLRIDNKSLILFANPTTYLQVSRKFYLRRVIYFESFDSIFEALNKHDFPCSIQLDKIQVNGFLLLPQTTKKFSNHSLVMINCKKDSINFYSDLKESQEEKEKYYLKEKYLTSIETKFPLKNIDEHFREESFLIPQERLLMIKNILNEFNQNFEYSLTEISIRQSEFMFIKTEFKEFRLEISLTSVDEELY